MLTQEEREAMEVEMQEHEQEIRKQYKAEGREVKKVWFCVGEEGSEAKASEEEGEWEVMSIDFKPEVPKEKSELEYLLEGIKLPVGTTCTHIADSGIVTTLQY